MTVRIGYKYFSLDGVLQGSAVTLDCKSFLCIEELSSKDFSNTIVANLELTYNILTGLKQ